ncbi:GAF domain-containing sensor histidine kinase [Candidatus Peregrinibacteria bacterium]|nr:GAF domain-containing sensor histidine kinase [Candidatus Peregrinibacteria bacterium]
MTQSDKFAIVAAGGVNFNYSLAGLNNIAEMILGNADPDITRVEILQYLENSLQTFGAVALEVDSKKKILVLKSFTQSKLIMRVMKMVPLDVYKLTYPLNANVLISRCVREDKVLSSSRLRDFFYPVFKLGKVLDVVQKVLGLKLAMAMPIKVNSKVIGAFFCVSKRASMSPTELQLLQLYANLYGIALENSKNIRNLNRLYEAEKETSAMLTHELKTPIAIAYNSSELLGFLIKKYEKSFQNDYIEKMRSHQLQIQESILRMNGIFNSIFSLTEVENNLTVDNQKLNLQESVGRIVDVYQTYKPDLIKLSYNHKIKKGIYYGPGIQFEQIISIVLENAFKYTKSGKIDVDLQMDGKKMVCTITDTGPGIADRDKVKVFERFVRANKAHSKHEKGLGLGLYIAKKIAEKLKGDIKLLNNPKTKGSRFVISFPVYTKKSE